MGVLPIFRAFSGDFIAFNTVKNGVKSMNLIHRTIMIWLVGWNMNGLFFPSYWECHHPNWRTPSFFRGVGLNHQPVMISLTSNQGILVMLYGSSPTSWEDTKFRKTVIIPQSHFLSEGTAGSIGMAIVVPCIFQVIAAGPKKGCWCSDSTSDSTSEDMKVSDRCHGGTPTGWWFGTWMDYFPQ